jgi:WD40 repeat protein
MLKFAHAGRTLLSLWGVCVQVFLPAACSLVLGLSPPAAIPVGAGQDAGHIGASVLSVAFSPDGKLLASAADDKTIRLGDVNTGRQIRVLTGHRLRVNLISFSPDGRYLASASDDRTVRIWEVNTGHELAKLDHDGAVVALAFSPDGHILATACGYGNACEKAPINFFDPSTGGVVRKLNGNRKGIHSLAFASDGRVLASAGYDGTVRLWDVSAGSELRQFQLKSPRYAYSVTFSPEGSLLAVEDDTTVHLLEPASLKELRTLDRPIGRHLAFSPDGRWLASSGGNPLLVVWDIRTWAATRSGFNESVASPQAEFSPDGHFLAQAYYNVIRLLDATTFRPVRTFGRFAPRPE